MSECHSEQLKTKMMDIFLFFFFFFDRLLKTANYLNSTTMINIKTKK